MLNILAKSFMTATRNPTSANRRSHWGAHERFDERRDAELIAHTVGRRRD